MAGLAPAIHALYATLKERRRPEVGPGCAGMTKKQMHRHLTGPVVIATQNPGKLAEMRELLAPYSIATESAGELGLTEPKETGKTFVANARIKAMAAAKAAGRVAFADDSGLVVDALGGEPGIHSARWAGPDKDFRFAMNKIQTLLIERGARALEQRRAHFVAALCLAWPDGHTEEFEGRVDGVAVWPPRGDKGFGYDPLFLPDGHERTFGEMSAEEKHGLPPHGRGLSHRARAFLKLADACLR
jgi:XTP/dITP diphosphohydrolase